MRPRRMVLNFERREEKEFQDKVVYINRVAKVVKGGKRFSFTALVVVGNGKGSVGSGLGKANEVPDAIKKAIEKGKKNLLSIPIVNGTITHESLGHYGASKVLLKPAHEGTGIIAGGAVRAVVELSGIKNVLSKSLGSNNPHNVLKATFHALSQLRRTEKAAGNKEQTPSKEAYEPAPDQPSSGSN